MEYSNDIRKAMQEIAQKNPNWVELGLFILRVGKSKAWKQCSQNFKSWLETFADILNITRASLFKYRAGVEIGLYLKALSISDDEKLIIEALSKTKADILETLGKIIPMIPSDVARKLTDDVFSGAVTRADLNSMYRLYKQSNQEKSPSSDKRIHAMSLAALVSAGTSWLENHYLKHQDILTYKLVANLRVLSLSNVAINFDAALAVNRQVEEKTQLDIHGLTFFQKENRLKVNEINLNHCDYNWLLFANEVDWDVNIMPALGILLIEKNDVTRVREASKTGQRSDVAISAHALLQALL